MISVGHDGVFCGLLFQKWVVLSSSSSSSSFLSFEYFRPLIDPKASEFNETRCVCVCVCVWDKSLWFVDVRFCLWLGEVCFGPTLTKKYETEEKRCWVKTSPKGVRKVHELYDQQIATFMPSHSRIVDNVNHSLLMPVSLDLSHQSCESSTTTSMSSMAIM